MQDEKALLKFFLHLHFHLVPKYTDEYEWGGVFAMNPKEKFLTDAEYDEMIEKLKKYL